MRAIEWTSDLSIEIAEVDDDHRLLIDHLNALFAACHAAQGHHVLEEGFDRLIALTRAHMRREDRLLEALPQPAMDAHRRDHRRFIDHLEKTRKKLPTVHDPNAIGETLAFLKTWMVRHAR